MKSVDLMSLWNAVCSVHLCKSVRNITHPLDEIRPMRLAGEFLLSRRIFLSLTELTDLTERFGAQFRVHEEVAPPPTPPRREGRNHRDTPIGLLAYFVKVFSLTEPTDLTEHFCAQFRSHRTPSAYRYHRTFLLMLAVRFCEIG